MIWLPRALSDDVVIGTPAVQLATLNCRRLPTDRSKQRLNEQPDWPHFPSPGPYGYGVAKDSSRYSPATTTIQDLSGQGNDGVLSGAAGVWMRSTQLKESETKAKHGGGGKLDRWGGVSVAGCLCECGYVPNGSAGPLPCLACEAGLHKPAWGTASCQSCGIGTYSAPAACACLDCPSNSTTASTASEQSDCLCNAGYTGPSGGTCEACSPGTYKQAPGSQTCELCEAGTYSPGMSI